MTYRLEDNGSYGYWDYKMELEKDSNGNPLEEG